MMKISPSVLLLSSSDFLDFLEKMCDESVLGEVQIDYKTHARLVALANTGDRWHFLASAKVTTRWIRDHIDYARWRLRDAVLRALEQ
jgi:hypothetical protein